MQVTNHKGSEVCWKIYCGACSHSAAPFIGKEGNCLHDIVMSVLFHWERRKLLSSLYSYVYSDLLGKQETAIFTI